MPTPMLKPTTPTLRACVAALLMTTSLAASPPATASPNDVLVAVQPAGESLTRATQERLVQFIEWTFKAPLTPSQRARLGEIIVAEWRLPQDREGLKEWLAAADHINTLAADQRPFVREKLLEEVLPALRAQAKTDADARWFIALYDAANKPIAAGNPALTRQMSDATIEMTYFILGKAHGADLQPSAADKDEWAKALVAGWPRLAAERKREIAGSPLQWAEVRASWDAAKESDRAEVAAQWRKDFPLPAATADAPLVASPAQRAALAKLREIDAYLAKPAAEWRAEDLAREADAIAKLAAQLRKEPAARATAERLTQMEKGLRDAGQRLRAPVAATSASAGGSAAKTAADLNRNMAAMQMQQQAFRSQMQFMEQMRQAQFNTIQNYGNNPYRYTNQFGR
jgi:hypothetical protein